jgi:MFS family permease
VAVTPGVTAVADVEAVQRRTVRLLVLAQAVGAVGITVGVSTASLLARDISGSETLAGLVQTAQVLGASLASYLLARLMARRGRRVGQVTGLLLGAAGALAAVVAGVVGSMVLLVLGALTLGATTAANAAARYAATDLATPTTRGRALSTVVWATTVGAVLGPNLSGPAGGLARRLGLPELTGPFLVGGVVMVVAALIVFLLMRPDPLLLARELADLGEEGPDGTSWSRARAAFARRPALLAAATAQALAHAVMIAVMIMTPLHMEHGGAELEVIGIVISVHVLGMFAFSPLVGLLADRVGRGPVLLAGAAILLVSLVLCGTSPEGHSSRIVAGLFLLGLGWSFATLAASATVADQAPLESRTDVQGVSDMAMGLTAAAAGAVSGVVVGAFGYSLLAAFAAVLALGVALAGTVVARHAR